MRIFCAGTVAVALMIAVDASAAVYMWEDDKGVTGFTEDYGTIPQKYRKKAKIVGQDQAEEPEAAAVEETQGTKALKPAVTHAGEGNGASPPAKVEKKLYGGKDESYWFNEFARLKVELQSRKDQLDAINARLAQSAHMSRSDYKSLDLNRKLLEEQEATMRKRYESLTKEADKAGVPQDLR